MAIHIHYESGSVSHVATPLHGLTYWLLEQAHLTEKNEKLNLELEIGRVKMFRSNIVVPSPDDESLIPSVVAATERRWNKTPEFDEEADSQDQALEILRWLEEWGDITKLEFNQWP